MNEVIDRLIQAHGEMWESVRDRADSPVLLTLDTAQNSPVWELSLEKGAHHPFWTIAGRMLTAEEWDELGTDLDKSRHSYVGTLIPITNQGGYTHLMVSAYIKNGRRPAEFGWSVTTEPVRVKILNGTEALAVSLQTFNENLTAARGK
jgi:hypothetical protein